MSKLKLQIVNKNRSMYVLKDENNKQYILYLEFYNITENPGIKDYIYISEKLLDPQYIEYDTHYFFGGLENPSGRKVKSIDDIDVIKVVVNKNECNLKRLYG